MADELPTLPDNPEFTLPTHISLDGAEAGLELASESATNLSPTPVSTQQPPTETTTSTRKHTRARAAKPTKRQRPPDGLEESVAPMSDGQPTNVLEDTAQPETAGAEQGEDLSYKYIEPNEVEDKQRDPLPRDKAGDEGLTKMTLGIGYVDTRLPSRDWDDPDGISQRPLDQEHVNNLARCFESGINRIEKEARLVVSISKEDWEACVEFTATVTHICKDELMKSYLNPDSPRPAVALKDLQPLCLTHDVVRRKKAILQRGQHRTKALERRNENHHIEGINLDSLTFETAVQKELQTAAQAWGWVVIFVDEALFHEDQRTKQDVRTNRPVIAKANSDGDNIQMAIRNWERLTTTEKALWGPKFSEFLVDYIGVHMNNLSRVKRIITCSEIRPVALKFTNSTVGRELYNAEHWDKICGHHCGMLWDMLVQRFVTGLDSIFEVGYHLHEVGLEQRTTHLGSLVTVADCTAVQTCFSPSGIDQERLTALFCPLPNDNYKFPSLQSLPSGPAFDEIVNKNDQHLGDWYINERPNRHFRRPGFLIAYSNLEYSLLYHMLYNTTRTPSAPKSQDRLWLPDAKWLKNRALYSIPKLVAVLRLLWFCVDPLDWKTILGTSPGQGNAQRLPAGFDWYEKFLPLFEKQILADAGVTDVDDDDYDQLTAAERVTLQHHKDRALKRAKTRTRKFFWELLSCVDSDMSNVALVTVKASIDVQLHWCYNMRASLVREGFYASILKAKFVHGCLRALINRLGPQYLRGMAKPLQWEGTVRESAGVMDFFRLPTPTAATIEPETVNAVTKANRLPHWPQQLITESAMRVSAGLDVNLCSVELEMLLIRMDEYHRFRAKQQVPDGQTLADDDARNFPAHPHAIKNIDEFILDSEAIHFRVQRLAYWGAKFGADWESDDLSLDQKLLHLPHNNGFKNINLDKSMPSSKVVFPYWTSVDGLFTPPCNARESDQIEKEITNATGNATKRRTAKLVKSTVRVTASDEEDEEVIPPPKRRRLVRLPSNPTTPTRGAPPLPLTPHVGASPSALPKATLTSQDVADIRLGLNFDQRDTEKGAAYYASASHSRGGFKTTENETRLRLIRDWCASAGKHVRLPSRGSDLSVGLKFDVAAPSSVKKAASKPKATTRAKAKGT